MSTLTREYLLYSLGYHPILALFILSLRLVQSWTQIVLSGWFLGPFDTHMYIYTLLPFWAQQHVPALSCFLFKLAPGPIISPRSPGSFSWRTATLLINYAPIQTKTLKKRYVSIKKKIKSGKKQKTNKTQQQQKTPPLTRSGHYCCPANTENIPIYITNACTQICIRSASICLSINMNMSLYWHLWPQFSIIASVHSSVLHLLICGFLLRQQETWLGMHVICNCWEKPIAFADDIFLYVWFLFLYTIFSSDSLWGWIFGIDKVVSYFSMDYVYTMSLLKKALSSPFFFRYYLFMP